LLRFSSRLFDPLARRSGEPQGRREPRFGPAAETPASAVSAPASGTKSAAANGLERAPPRVDPPAAVQTNARWPPRVPAWLRFSAVLGLAVMLLPYLLAPVYRYGEPVSTLMLWRWATGARVERLWVPLEAMSPALPRAVIAAEDARFCEHHGIDWGALRHVVETAEDGGEWRGASTITQQIAKNLFLWPGRSFVRKGLEFPLALFLDAVLPKRRILEIYLNLAEWGPDGEFGAEAAARRAFGRPAHDLTLAQSALLAATLPNPIDRNAAHPSRPLLRLAALYQARVRQSAPLNTCVPAPTTNVRSSGIPQHDPL
jgi:monofunctional glycosyltransferase